MKVLFVGNTRRTALALNYFTNLVKLGYLVLPYDPDYFRTQNPWESLAVRLRRAPTAGRVHEVGASLIELCRRNRFDVVLVMAENFLGADVIQEIKKVSKQPPLVVYHSHDNNFAPGILKPPDFADTVRAYDFVFTTKSQNVARYRSLGQPDAHFLPSAFEPTIHHPVGDEYSFYAGQRFEVTFIGTYDQSRAKFLDAVGWNRLRVWGDGWRRSPTYWRNRDRVAPRAIYEFEFADVTSHSKLGLGLLREEAQDLHTTRTFEIPACATLQIAPRNPEILSFFRENDEIVCFASPEELKDKVDFYLRHDAERARIARNGFDRCLRDKHTYLDRVMQMFQIVKTKRAESRLVQTQTLRPTAKQTELTS